MSIYVVGVFDKVPENSVVVNTTSRSSAKWSQDLSPFLLGLVNLYNGYVSQNVENAWQYSKCYKQHNWNGEKLDYIEARKKIYIPLYFSTVIKTSAYERLKQMCFKGDDIYLRCFDGYNHKKLSMSYKDVVNNKDRSMGHSFVLAMMLEKELKHE